MLCLRDSDQILRMDMSTVGMDWKISKMMLCASEEVQQLSSQILSDTSTYFT